MRYHIITAREHTADKLGRYMKLVPAVTACWKFGRFGSDMRLSRRTVRICIGKGGNLMKSYEMVETLSQKAHVSLEQAKEALENSNWDILDAAIYIERRKTSAGAPPTQPPAQGAYFVSGRMPDYQGSYATPGFNRPGAFDPRTDFNKPYGGGYPPVPPYKNFPRQESVAPPPPYKDFPRQAPPAPPYGGFAGQNPPPPQYGNYPPKTEIPIGEAVGRAAGVLEKIVNGIFNFSFVVTRHGNVVMSIPALIFFIALLMFLPFMIPCLVLGLAFDCRYSFGVYTPDTGRTIEDVVEQAVKTAVASADKAKENIMTEAQNVKATYEQSKKEFTEDFRKGRASVNGVSLEKTEASEPEKKDGTSAETQPQPQQDKPASDSTEQ